MNQAALIGTVRLTLLIAIGALLVGCEKPATNAPSKHVTPESPPFGYKVVSFEGHKYIAGNYNYGGITHAQSCECLKPKTEPELKIESITHRVESHDSNSQ
jgi:hypothetical protein